jgi:hypothetical protein
MQAALGFALASAGRRQEAEAILAELDRLSKGREVSPYYMAVVAAGLGRRAEVDRRLDEARTLRSPRLRDLRISPVWHVYARGQARTLPRATRQRRSLPQARQRVRPEGTANGQIRRHERGE